MAARTGMSVRRFRWLLRFGRSEGAGGNFDGADAAGSEVVDCDAEEVVAGGGNVDVAVGVGAAAQHGLVDRWRDDGANGVGGRVDRVALGVVDADSVLKLAAVVSVFAGCEADAVDVDEIGDGVMPVGRLHLFRVRAIFSRGSGGDGGFGDVDAEGYLSSVEHAKVKGALHGTELDASRRSQGLWVFGVVFVAIGELQPRLVRATTFGSSGAARRTRCRAARKERVVIGTGIDRLRRQIAQVIRVVVGIAAGWPQLRLPGPTAQRGHPAAQGR